MNGGLLQDTDGLGVTLGIAAATGLGVLAFSEVEPMSNCFFTTSNNPLWGDCIDILFVMLLY